VFNGAFSACRGPFPGFDLWSSDLRCACRVFLTELQRSGLSIMDGALANCITSRPPLRNSIFETAIPSPGPSYSDILVGASQPALGSLLCPVFSSPISCRVFFSLLESVNLDPRGFFKGIAFPRLATSAALCDASAA